MQTFSLLQCRQLAFQNTPLTFPDLSICGLSVTVIVNLWSIWKIVLQAEFLAEWAQIFCHVYITTSANCSALSILVDHADVASVICHVSTIGNEAHLGLCLCVGGWGGQRVSKAAYHNIVYHFTTSIWKLRTTTGRFGSYMAHWRISHFQCFYTPPTLNAFLSMSKL